MSVLRVVDLPSHTALLMYVLYLKNAYKSSFYAILWLLMHGVNINVTFDYVSQLGQKLLLSTKKLVLVIIAK